MRIRAATAALTTVAVVVVVAGVRLGIGGLGGAECSGEVGLAVAAAPDVAAAVRDEVEAWSAAKAEVGGACLRIDVQAAEPADVTALLSGKARVTPVGGRAARPGVAPDVWISDSGTWLQRLRSAAPAVAFTEEGSIAFSPVVMAMPVPTAKKLGWTRKKPGYSDLLNLITTSTTTRTGTVDPARDAAALSGLLALGAAATAADQRRPGTSNGVLRAMATDTSVLRADLMAQLPQADDDESLAAGLSLAAMSESDVVRFNATGPPVALAALYLKPAPVPLDHPFAVLPGLSQAQAEAAHQLFLRLAGGGFRDRLAEAGLRSPDGTTTAGFAGPAGAPSQIVTGAAADSGSAAASEADGATIDRALASWSAVVAPARMLAVVDASASMRTPVPTARNATRMQLTIAAARGGLGLFSDEWSVGLWASAGGPGGGRRELVGIHPLTSHRNKVATALAGIEPASGEAGLYRTILDGYRTVQSGWQAGRVNSVLVLTDGVGIGVGDLALGDLVDKLKDAKAADKPVQVIVLGIGGSVDRKPLEQITQVTGGGVFVAEDPAQIGAVFLDALSLRTTATR
jgi:Ca-activated chloride channel family protein